jgi:hypothetical protein
VLRAQSNTELLGVVEDNPVPKAMYPDARVDRGFYAGDGAGLVAEELDIAGDLFARTLTRLEARHLERPIFYGYPTPATRTVRWVAAQALHEVEHHAGDVADDVRLLGIWHP